MYLTNEEEKLLAGEGGPVKEKAMEILVALGEIYGADRLIPISSVQVSGVSYKSLGDAGLEWIRSLEGERVRVPATMNPAGMDLERWREMGVPRDFAEKQMEIIDAYKRLGVMCICSCTPYLTGNTPLMGDHIAWSESSAVCYANSVLGARTNREGGPSALASALIGKTPNYGYHREEERRPTLRVKVSVELREESDFSSLGYWTGKIARNGVPYFTGIKGANPDQLKALAAALAASGGVALYHIEGITPEASQHSGRGLEGVEFGVGELREAYQVLSMGRGGGVDLVCFGCPHASIHEVRRVVEGLRGRVRDGVRFWIFTSIGVRRIAERLGYLDMIHRAGGKIYTDCCMVVAPIRRLGVESMAVNSSKAALYSPSISKVDTLFTTMKGCMDLALEEA